MTTRIMIMHDGGPYIVEAVVTDKDGKKTGIPQILTYRGDRTELSVFEGQNILIAERGEVPKE